MFNRRITLLCISASFLLSGCSSSEINACGAAEQAAADYANEAKVAGDKLNTFSNEQIAGKNRDEVIALLQAMNDLTLKSYKVIVNNQSCFSPKEVVEAQTNLGE
jgi:hypothetical protein